MFLFRGALAFECPLQSPHLLSDFLAALLRVEEDVVWIAVLFVPFVVHALEPGCVFLLQVLQALHQLIVGLGARVFQRDPIGIEKFLPKQAKMLQPFEAQKRSLKAAIHGLQSFVGVEFCGAELQLERGKLPSVIAICQPVLCRRCVVRAALVFAHRRVPAGYLLNSRIRRREWNLLLIVTSSFFVACVAQVPSPVDVYSTFRRRLFLPFFNFGRSLRTLSISSSVHK